MSDLGAGGTIDYSAIGNFTVRANSNTTDIRRTVAPEPNVIGTAHIDQPLSGFTNVNNAIFGDGDTKKLNSGVLFRSIEGGASVYLGITLGDLSLSKCFVIEDGEDVFIPTEDLGRVFMSGPGATLSIMGE